jgi:hypothetical protein
MTRRSSKPTEWIPVNSRDGIHHGEYQVSEGMLTVRREGQQKSARASSTGVPAALGANADRSLAMFMLGELIGHKPA